MLTAVRIAAPGVRWGSVPVPQRRFHRYGGRARQRNRTFAAVTAFLLAWAALGSPAVAQNQDDATPGAGAPVTIAMLGDSLTQGYGLPPEDGLVAQLQRWLDARGNAVRLINAGVSGDTTAGGLARIGWTLTGDVQGLVVALGGNDVLRGIAPQVARANLSAILEHAHQARVAVLLVGVSAPLNYGPDYKRDFDAIYTDLAAKFDIPLFPDLLAPLTADGTTRQQALATLMQPDAIHPNARGVARIVAALGPHVERLAARIRAEAALQANR